MYSENRLMHYGIKGMHWGVRRFQPYSSTGPRKSGKSGTETGQAKRRAKKAAVIAASPTGYAAYKGAKRYKKATQARYEKSDYAKAKKMSDSELRTRINRINLEQSYVQAMQRDREAYRDASQGVLRRHGRKSVKYALGLGNNKKFKEKAASVAARAVFG